VKCLTANRSKERSLLVAFSKIANAEIDLIKINQQKAEG